MSYNILHVIPYMHPSAGGPPVVVENFITETNRLGHRSQIISTPSYCNGDESNLQKRLEQLAPTTFLNGLETLPVLSRTGAAKINAHVRQADIVHVHTLWSPLNVSARYACLRHDRPYVLMPHGMLDPYSLSVKALKKFTYLRLFERHNMAQCSAHDLHDSRGGAAGGLGRLAVAARRAGPARRERQFCFERRPARSIFGEISSSRRKANVALSRTTSSQKRARSHPELLAISQAGRSRMCFWSSQAMGMPTILRHLRQLVSALALDDHVLFAGRLDGELKWASFAAAELFLLPSRQENFAITVAEAMQMGVPVIITRQGQYLALREGGGCWSRSG